MKTVDIFAFVACGVIAGLVLATRTPQKPDTEPEIFSRQDVDLMASMGVLI